MSDFKVTVKEIEDATIEAIYWWNRTEFHYNKYFTKIDIICKDKELKNFFNRTIFEVFLKEYSIRRNLNSKYQTVDKFLDDLVKMGFFAEVKRRNANITIIDTTSAKLKSKGSVTAKETKSLLSKIAFLVNPSVFALYDTLAKASLWKIVANSKLAQRKDLESYNGYYRCFEELLSEVKKQKHFEKANKILEVFNGTEAHLYFTKNKKAFELRVVDKLLWIKGQSVGAREINNEQYIKLLKLSRQ